MCNFDNWVDNWRCDISRLNGNVRVHDDSMAIMVMGCDNVRLHDRSVGNWVDNEVGVYLGSRDGSLIDHDVRLKWRHLRHGGRVDCNMRVVMQYMRLSSWVDDLVGFLDVDWSVIDMWWCNFDGWLNNGSEVATS